MAIDFPDSPSNGTVLTIGLKEWTFAGGRWLATGGGGGGGASALDDLTDVTITAVSNGQVLKYNGSAWVNAADSVGTTINSIDDITDVTITSASSGQFLKWNGSAWVNDTIDLGADTTGSFIASLVAGTGISLSNNSGEAATPTVTVDTGVIQARVADVSDTEIGYLNGVTSAIQTQIDTKAPLASPTFTGTVSGVTKTMVGLGNVDNTSDANKPVSTATQTALDLKSNLASPTFTGTLTANDLTVSGNLTVSGTTTSINTETVTVDDNIIVLNNNATGAPSVDAGIEVERGSSTNVLIRWNESTDKWQFTNDGSTYVDFDKSPVTVSSSAPASPINGQLWFYQDTAQTFIYYGTAWIEVGAVSNGARVEVSSVAPASPATGDLWFDSDTAQTFTYYDSQWIEIGASGMAASIGDTAPTSPISGQIWFDSTNASTNVYYDSQWVEVGGTTEIFNFIESKGDLIVGTADNVVDNLSVGTNGQVLTADSTTATGLKWDTPVVYQEVVANVSNTEIGYLDGVTSGIQTQINTKASTGKAIAMSLIFGGG